MNATGTESTTGLILAPPDATVKPDVFLKRLHRLLVLRYQASNYLDVDDVRLLDRCIFATFCDCKEVGAEELARRLLEQARSTQVRAAG
jgi:hypothetical protein